MSESDLILNKLIEAQRSIEDASSRISSLEGRTEEEIRELREHVTAELSRIELQMGTTNAHLDNLFREAGISNAHHDRTNELLKKDIDERRLERKRQQDLADARLKHEQQLETDRLLAAREEQSALREDKKEIQEKLFGAASEAWGIFKQPLAYLLVAFVGYVAWYFFGAAPMQTTSVPVFPPTQVEADE